MNGKGKVSLQNVDCTLEGNFVNGKLHGPVRGLTSKGKSVVDCPSSPKKIWLSPPSIQIELDTSRCLVFFIATI